MPQVADGFLGRDGGGLSAVLIPPRVYSGHNTGRNNRPTLEAK
jgi:hypothetical protein